MSALIITISEHISQFSVVSELPSIRQCLCLIGIPVALPILKEMQGFSLACLHFHVSSCTIIIPFVLNGRQDSLHLCGIGHVALDDAGRTKLI